MDPDTDRLQDSEIDDLVCGALAPRPLAAERIVDAALRTAQPDAPVAADYVFATPFRRAFAAVGAVVLGGVVLGGALYWNPMRQAPPPRGTLSNHGSIIILAMPGDPITIVGPGSGSSPVPAGTASVELLGEPQ